MAFRPEVVPFLFVALALGALVFCAIRLCRVARGRALAVGGIVAVLLGVYMLYFFRDPPRQAPADPALIVAGADGTIMSVTDLQEPNFLKTNAVRISIFLSLFDVHVNRAPIGGVVDFAKDYPGSRYFTFLEKSSDFNQHSTIVIRGKDTSCIVNQIVGPIARRVVHWVQPAQAVQKGESIGMMKFGSRLDMVFPKDDVEIVVTKGMKVRAGETVVARLKAKVAP